MRLNRGHLQREKHCQCRRRKAQHRRVAGVAGVVVADQRTDQTVGEPFQQGIEEQKRQDVLNILDHLGADTVQAQQHSVSGRRQGRHRPGQP